MNTKRIVFGVLACLMLAVCALSYVNSDSAEVSETELAIRKDKIRVPPNG